MILDEIVKPPSAIRYLDEVAERLGYHDWPATSPRLLLPSPARMDRRTICLRTRKIFFNSFLDGVFIVPYLSGKSVDFCVQWLETLDKELRYQVKDIRCVTVASNDSIAWNDAFEADARGKFRVLRMEHAVRFGSEDEITADLDDYLSQAILAIATSEQQNDSANVSVASTPQQTITAPSQLHSHGNFRGEGHILGKGTKSTSWQDDDGWSEDEEEIGDWDEVDEDEGEA